MSENESDYFFWNRRAFEDSIKEMVCPQCPYVGPSPQECKNPDPHGCALFRYLPDLVRVAQRMERPNLKDYAAAVKTQITFHCEGKSAPDSECDLLDSPRCGLDRLLPYVLEATLKTDKSLEARANFPVK